MKVLNHFFICQFLKLLSVQYLAVKAFLLTILLFNISISFCLDTDSFLLAPNSNLNNSLIPLNLEFPTQNKLWNSLNTFKIKYLKYYSQFAPNCFNHRDHASMVAEFVYSISNEIGVDQKDIKQIYQAAILHDLGHKNEDIGFNSKFFQFCRQNIENFFRNDLFFTENELQAELDKTIDILMKNNFLDFFKGEKIKIVTENHQFKELVITEKNCRIILRDHLSKTIHFAPLNSLKLAKKYKINLTPLEICLIRFHHSSAEVLSKFNLLKLFPDMSESNLNTLYEKILYLLPILKTADSLEAGNSRKRAIFYNREKETLEDTFQNMYKRFIKRDINIESYNAVIKLLKDNNLIFQKLLYLCRRYPEGKTLPEEDIFFVKQLKYLKENDFSTPMILDNSA